MPRETGLRERKKLQTRHHLADVAARLFAERGYDAVSIVDVARAADVSDQTVYNYFSAKQELVLDRADEIREQYGRVIRERPRGTSPAQAFRMLLHEDIDRFRNADPVLAPGEFPAQCILSPALRRYALEYRERQVETVAAAIAETTPGIEPIVARAHASALISVIQTITDEIGRRVLAPAAPNAVDAAAVEMTRSVELALGHLDRSFRIITITEGRASS